MDPCVEAVEKVMEVVRCDGGGGGRWGVGGEGLGVAVSFTVRVAGVMLWCRWCCGRRQWRCWCGGREAST